MWGLLCEFEDSSWPMSLIAVGSDGKISMRIIARQASSRVGTGHG